MALHRGLRGRLLAASALTLVSFPALAQGITQGDTAAARDKGNIVLAQNIPANDEQYVQVAAAGPINEVLVTARGVGILENVQQVAIPISVVGGEVAGDAGAFNVGRLRELVPSLQFYSTNPRNSFLNIRGLGLPFGLANDGIEPGVGLYVDGVFHARPAAATLDFLDVERIEVLRGPQGTLYGKNTTAGAVNVTTRRPEFAPSTDFEVSYGNYGFIQVKASTTGALTDNIAACLSFAGTQRDGVLFNTTYDDDLNDLNNLGVRGQVLFNISDNLEAILSGDYTRQRPEGYAQVIAGVAPTLRSASRQWPAIAAYFNYEPPSYNGFNRITDADTVHNSYQDLGGLGLTFNWDVWGGTFTSISAWRYWDWKPKNDRDFTGLPITTISSNPSQQEQWTQEFRYTGEFSEALNFLVGAFGYRQTVKAQGQQ
jgi:iron complex outermembrane receptor protein